MERRVFLTLIACTLFTLVYMKYIEPPPTKGAAGSSATDGKGAGGADVEVAPPSASGPGGAADGQAAPGAAAWNAGPQAIAPFESELLRVDLTNRGAGIQQTHLRKYTNRAEDDPDDADAWVTLFPDPGADEAPDQAMALLLRPMPSRERAALPLATDYWEVAADETDEAGVREVTFRYAAAGLELLKRLRFRPDSYAVEVELVSRGSDGGPATRPFLFTTAAGIRDVPRGWFTDQVGAPSAVVLQQAEGKSLVHRHAAGALAEESESYAGVSFAGCANLYFLALVEPAEGLACDAELTAISEQRPERVRADLVVELGFPADGAASTAALRLYAGPKDPRLMEERGHASLLPLIEEDYGSWHSLRWVNRLLLGGLRLFHGFLGNWGLAIILLTLVIRILVFPITRTQQVSMQRYSQKMQELKPKLDKLKEKYKANPQKFAQEQMNLLREHNARPPVVGCLSMFVTFPVFIGMFQLLRTAIELRHAPFVGWIHDLSLPDGMFGIPGTGWEFNLLPILATAAFVAQMAMAPKPADPQAQQQQKIMMVMPVVFGVMFYGYAAGLSLYMLTTSLYSIFETRVIKKRFFPNPVPTSAPAAPAR